VALSATLLSTKAFFSTEEWVADSTLAKAACVGGVFTGALLWFLFWSFIMSRGHGKFSAKSLLRLQHVSGLCLIITAVYEGLRIAWHLAQHKI